VGGSIGFRQLFDVDLHISTVHDAGDCILLDAARLRMEPVNSPDRLGVAASWQLSQLVVCSLCNDMTPTDAPRFGGPLLGRRPEVGSMCDLTEANSRHRLSNQ
jgi:hypothetical protein